MLRMLEGWLPLRGRWLRYFMGAVVLASVVLLTPAMPRCAFSCTCGTSLYWVSLWDVLHGR